MHAGAQAVPRGEAGQPNVRSRARRLVRGAALLANAALFAAGLYFEAHPRDRSDRWSAAGVAAVALVNSAALSLPARDPRSESAVRRLRRVSLILNGLLAAIALVIVALASPRGLGYAGLHGALLFVPPLVTILALRRYPQG